MIKDEKSSKKFVGLMIKPILKSISTLLKLKLTKMNLSSIKIQEKEKITCFFHLEFLAPTSKPTICKYSLAKTFHIN
jgi:hypothetical protein